MSYQVVVEEEGIGHGCREQRRGIYVDVCNIVERGERNDCEFKGDT